jgi:hypothetical protein
MVRWVVAMVADQSVHGTSTAQGSRQDINLQTTAHIVQTGAITGGKVAIRPQVSAQTAKAGKCLNPDIDLTVTTNRHMGYKPKKI